MRFLYFNVYDVSHVIQNLLKIKQDIQKFCITELYFLNYIIYS